MIKAHFLKPKRIRIPDAVRGERLDKSFCAMMALILPAFTKLGKSKSVEMTEGCHGLILVKPNTALG